MTLRPWLVGLIGVLAFVAPCAAQAPAETLKITICGSSGVLLHEAQNSDMTRLMVQGRKGKPAWHRS
jgi:hypothetical protein